MIVDLYDAKTHSLVWRGIAQNTLNNNGNNRGQSCPEDVQAVAAVSRFCNHHAAPSEQRRKTDA
jgi:hypothetical protein